ncbi:MAG: malto-oligosyltrehalose trehalohydrolase [Solirubrobacteraceae bacterium]
MTYAWERRLGAVPCAGGEACFRVWAPRAQRVAVRLRGEDHALKDAGHGVHERLLAASAGEDYWIVLDGTPLADPCSRWQPAGIRGPSRVLDTREFEWSDRDWSGVALEDLVLYELHVGAFTQEGTFAAVIGHLRGLRELGVTAIELMPVAEFPGRRGWGYDGVQISATFSGYGGPRGLQRLIDAAHAAGIGVVLDVVYNHVGASGVEAMEAFGPYFTDKHKTPWGKAINYDDEQCDPVREWVLQSAEGWVRDFHLDGLRLDAIHAIHDESARPILRELAARVHALDPRALVIAESALNDPQVIRPVELGGHGHDAQWADDFHHALRALLTGERDGYYADFGALCDLAKAFRRPFVHDGTYSAYRRRRFGAPAGDQAPAQFVVFAQNHDQVGNRALGDRLPVAARPLAAFCVLLSPFTPMLFMGEEYGERAPFQYFTDHIDVEIARATREGRRQEFARFAAYAGELPDPQAPETFMRSKLTREHDGSLCALYAELLRVRGALPGGDAEVSFDEAERWLRVRRGRWQLLCNFAQAEMLVPCAGAEVLLATHPAVRAERDGVRLPALAGALMG